jgi:hypothetical protein
MKGTEVSLSFSPLPQAVQASGVSQADLWRAERTRLDRAAHERRLEVLEAANLGLQQVL